MEALNARFELLLSNIPQGVAWFGHNQASHRQQPVRRNLRSLDRGRGAGAPLEEILAKRAAKGMFVESPKAYIKARVATIPSSDPVHLLDRLMNGQSF